MAADYAAMRMSPAARPTPAILAFYKLRWALDDIAAYTAELRAPHEHTPGTEQAWHALQVTVATART
jgi:spectinomycin phosphotransferase